MLGVGLAETIRDTASERDFSSFGLDLESLFNQMMDEVVDELGGIVLEGSDDEEFDSDDIEEMIQRMLNVIDK